MGFLTAGILAAAVSWVGNRTALKLIGVREIVVLAPLIEETAKTGAALITGSPVILTHGVFGLVEGTYDAWGAGMSGLKAGVTGLAGHVFYGYVTSLVLSRHNIIFYAILSGYIIHMLWNFTVLKLVVKKRRHTA